ncbi:MAG: AraC family transcriptional regulator [Flavobacterium sp.]
MKTITHHYGTDLQWVNSLATSYEGYVEGNFIKVPEHIHTGVRYFLPCSEGIVAFYIDVEYNMDIELIQKNLTDDFVGIYYNLTDGVASVTSDNIENIVGFQKYDLAVIDSSLISHYLVKEGSKTFALCIFIKKDIIKSFAERIPSLNKFINTLTNPEKNTIIRFDKMSSISYNLLADLRKLEVGDYTFNLNLMATVNLLIAEYLNNIPSRTIIIKTVNEIDLAAIFKIKSYLLNNIYDPFPSIETIAREAHMSESKFKLLFKKIIGDTPNSYFMNNKLIKAKELLQGGQHSIADVANKLNFADNSYFTAKFKNHFGVLPKTFIEQL